MPLEGNLSGDCDVEKNDKRTGFVDSDYAMGRSITMYGFMIQGCAKSWKAYLQHMKALSTTEAAHMTVTEAAKEAIWLKGLAIESGFKLKIVAGISTGLCMDTEFNQGLFTLQGTETRLYCSSRKHFRDTEFLKNRRSA
ncbi:hypothetical protein Tco_0343498 [Tanacetum coccineum]